MAFKELISIGLYISIFCERNVFVILCASVIHFSSSFVLTSFI